MGLDWRRQAPRGHLRSYDLLNRLPQSGRSRFRFSPGIV
jgi:hypothetical protein